MTNLVDGKGQQTKWNYAQYGRVTNKLDQAGTVVLRYTYDADNRLLSRWSAAMGTTYYTNDPLGSLTYIKYPHTFHVQMKYDWLNRLTNMVDGLGTTLYGYTAAGQLLTEDGPFANDTVTNTYSNRLRVGLGLQQPAGDWTNAFAYDAARRMSNIGGLLARSDGYTSGNWTNHNYYHADALGNIMYLIDTNQSMTATYRYDPFGNTLSSSGSLSSVNVYRFSSKEIHANSGFYYYLYRFYMPGWQRWPNRDPIGEPGGRNLYFITHNDSINGLDDWGLKQKCPKNTDPKCGKYFKVPCLHRCCHFCWGIAGGKSPFPIKDPSQEPPWLQAFGSSQSANVIPESPRSTYSTARDRGTKPPSIWGIPYLECDARSQQE